MGHKLLYVKSFNGDSTGWIRSTVRVFIGTVQLYVNMVVTTFDCNSQVDDLWIEF